MFTVGTLVFCSLIVTTKIDDIPFRIRNNSAYGAVKKVHDDEKKLIVNFTEFTNQNKNILGDYSEIAISYDSCDNMK